jgi:hypothetical protein
LARFTTLRWKVDHANAAGSALVKKVVFERHEHYVEFVGALMYGHL